MEESKSGKPKDIVILNDVSPDQLPHILPKSSPIQVTGGVSLSEEKYSVIMDPNDFNIAFQNRVGGIADAAEFWVDQLDELNLNVDKRTAKEEIDKLKKNYIAEIQKQTDFENYQIALAGFYQALINKLQEITRLSAEDIRTALQQAEKYEGIRPRPNITTVTQIPIGKKGGKDVLGYLIQSARPATPLAESAKHDYIAIYRWDGDLENTKGLPEWFIAADKEDKLSLHAALKKQLAGATNITEMRNRLDTAFFQSGVRIGPGVANFFICETEVVDDKGHPLTSRSRLPQLRSAIFPSPHAKGDVQHTIALHNLQQIAHVGAQQYLAKHPALPDAKSDDVVTIPLYTRTLISPTRIFVTVEDRPTHKAKLAAIEAFRAQQEANSKKIPPEYTEINGRKVRFEIINVNHPFNNVARQGVTSVGILKLNYGGKRLVELAEDRMEYLKKLAQSEKRSLRPEEVQEYAALRAAIQEYQKLMGYTDKVTKEKVKGELQKKGHYGEDGHLRVCRAESRLADLLGAVIWDACMEGKDRTTNSKVNEDARLVSEARAEYARLNGTTALASTPAQDYAMVYATGHHRKLTGIHGAGVEGSKKPDSYLPAKYIRELNKRLGAGFMEKSRKVAETFNQEKMPEDRRKFSAELTPRKGSQASSVTKDAIEDDKEDSRHSDAETYHGEDPLDDKDAFEGSERVYDEKADQDRSFVAGSPSRSRSESVVTFERDMSDAFYDPDEIEARARAQSKAGESKAEESKTDKFSFLEGDDDELVPAQSPGSSLSMLLEPAQSPGSSQSLISSAGSPASSVRSVSSYASSLSRISSSSIEDSKRSSSSSSVSSPPRPNDRAWMAIVTGSITIPPEEFTQPTEDPKTVAYEILRNFEMGGKKPKALNPMRDKGRTDKDLEEIMDILGDPQRGGSAQLAEFRQVFVGGSGIVAKLQAGFEPLFSYLGTAAGGQGATFTAYISGVQPLQLTFSTTCYARIPATSEGPPNVVYHAECQVTKTAAGGFTVSPMKMAFKINDKDPALYAGLEPNPALPAELTQISLFSGISDTAKNRVLAACAADIIVNAGAQYSIFSPKIADSRLLGKENPITKIRLVELLAQKRKAKKAGASEAKASPAAELVALKENIKRQRDLGKKWLMEIKEKISKEKLTPEIRDLKAVFVNQDERSLSALKASPVADMLTQINNIITKYKIAAEAEADPAIKLGKLHDGIDKGLNNFRRSVTPLEAPAATRSVLRTPKKQWFKFNFGSPTPKAPTAPSPPKAPTSSASSSGDNPPKKPGSGPTTSGPK